MAICDICGKSAGLAKAHPHCETQVRLGVSPETIRAADQRAAAQATSVAVATDANRLKVSAAILSPFIVIAFCLVGFSAGHEEMAVVLGFLGVVIGSLFATLLYSLCAVFAGVSERVVAHVDRPR